MAQPDKAADERRRDFLKRTLSVVLGSGAVLVPMGAGVAFVMDPLRRSAGASEKVRVTTLAALPADGAPVKFPILAARVDAWNKLPNAPVGAIYLRRTGDREVKAFNVVCPHAGCFVDYRGDIKGFYCPCHNSAFELDGSIRDKGSPSPRGLDHLEVELRGDEVWVHFQNFLTGTPARIPLA